MIKVKTPPKPLRIATTFGHVVLLPESTTVDIPEAVVSEACTRGCVVVDSNYDPDPQAQAPTYGKQAAERNSLNEIKAVIEHMMEDKKDHEWTADGLPDAKAISRRRDGARTTKAQRDKVWNEHFVNERVGDSE